MEFSAEQLVGASVKCVSATGEVTTGKLLGLDSTFNVSIRDAQVQGCSEEGNQEQRSPSATATWLNGAHIVYIGLPS